MNPYDLGSFLYNAESGSLKREVNKVYHTGFRMLGGKLAGISEKKDPGAFCSDTSLDRS